MHEHHTLAMIESKLSETRDKTAVKKIVVGRDEVHDIETFKQNAKQMLEEKFPEANTEIEVRDPEMICPACGYKTNEMIEICPECETKMNLETNKGVRLEF